MKPLFIVFEGIDGAGTTTQSDRLAKILEGEGHSVVITREPGGTEIGERIRDLVLDPTAAAMTGLTELLLCSASRSQHVSEVILPALKSGKPVISDRYADSTLAYQGAGRGLDNTLVSHLNGVSTMLCRPDVTIYLDLPTEVARERTKSREPDRMEQEPNSFRQRVAEVYRILARENPDTSLLVDAQQEAADLARNIHCELISRWPAFPFTSNQQRSPDATSVQLCGGR